MKGGSDHLCTSSSIPPDVCEPRQAEPRGVASQLSNICLRTGGSYSWAPFPTWKTCSGWEKHVLAWMKHSYRQEGRPNFTLPSNAESWHWKSQWWPWLLATSVGCRWFKAEKLLLHLQRRDWLLTAAFQEKFKYSNPAIAGHSNKHWFLALVGWRRGWAAGEKGLFVSGLGLAQCPFSVRNPCLCLAVWSVTSSKRTVIVAGWVDRKFRDLNTPALQSWQWPWPSDLQRITPSRSNVTRV